MLTQEQVLAAVRGGRKSQCLDGRDYSRLVDFFPVTDWNAFGFEVKEGATPPEPKPWTEESIRDQLARDLDFAFEKAHGRRGISASLMHEVVKTWMWVLEDDLQNYGDYDDYGVAYLRQVAQKYGLPDLGDMPDGDDED